MDPYEVDYRGAASLTLGGERLSAEVVLAGHFEPLDGKYHWYGRVSGSVAVRAMRERAARGAVDIALPECEAVPARLTEIDPHGNVRVEGIGQPPYALETLTDIEAHSTS